MKKYSLIIRPKYSIIHTCKCGNRFIEIQAEIDMGYKRKKCPWCVSYRHNKKTPRMTHDGMPYNLDPCNLVDYLKRVK